MPNAIPDSIDSLNLSGILPFDAKSYIMNGTMTSIPSQQTPQEIKTGFKRDEFTPSAKKEKRHHQINPKMGILGASLVFLAFTILGKKIPKIGEFTSKISSGIGKIFKK